MLLSITRYLHGYVTVHIRTGDPLRLINNLGKENIYFFGTKVTDDGVILSVFDNDYEYFLYIAQRSNAEIYSSKQRGTKFYIKSTRVKRSIYISLILGLAVYIFSYYCILRVEISGNNLVSEKEIYNVLEELNVRPLVFCPTFDGLYLAERVKQQLPTLSWVAVNKNGSKVEVIVSERKRHEEIQRKDPCNIVASQSGLITHMNVREGMGVVAVKEAVKKGDILVSGVVETKKQQTYYVHADADVYAEIDHSKTYMMDMKKANIEYTSLNVKRYYFNIFGKEIPLFSEPPDDRLYFEKVTKQTIKLFGYDTGIPYILKTRDYYKPAEKVLTQEDVLTILRQNFTRYEKEDMRGMLVVKKKESYKVVDEKVYMRVKYKVIKNIANKVEIKIKK